MNWMDRMITIQERDGFPIEVPAYILFFGGMEKKDLAEMINKAPSKEVASDIIMRRETAGQILTEMNISTMYATQLLINIGEAAFQRGNRDPWAIYAHNKLNQKTSGCLKTIAIVVVAIIVLIFFCSNSI